MLRTGSPAGLRIEYRERITCLTFYSLSIYPKEGGKVGSHKKQLSRQEAERRWKLVQLSCPRRMRGQSRASDLCRTANLLCPKRRD